MQCFHAFDHGSKKESQQDGQREWKEKGLPEVEEHRHHADREQDRKRVGTNEGHNLTSPSHPFSRGFA